MNGEDISPSPTNLVDLMNELVPPPEPEPISLVPQTIAWPILAGLIIALGVFLIWRLRRKRHAEAYRAAALLALESSENDPETVARILRQTALTAFPRTDVASLYGSEWLAFLDATCDTAEFQTGPGAALASAPYRTAEALSDATIRAVQNWIRCHKRPVAP